MENKISQIIRKKAYVMLEEHCLEWNALAKNASLDTNMDLEVTDKLLNRVYGIVLTIHIKGLNWNENFSCKARFLGTIKAKGVLFQQENGSGDLTKKINREEALLLKIYETSKILDLERIKIQYNVPLDLLEVHIKPYAGVYVWVKFPPIQKRIPLKIEELKALHELAVFLRNYFTVESNVQAFGA